MRRAWWRAVSPQPTLRVRSWPCSGRRRRGRWSSPVAGEAPTRLRARRRFARPICSSSRSTAITCGSSPARRAAEARRLSRARAPVTSSQVAAAWSGEHGSRPGRVAMSTAEQPRLHRFYSTDLAPCPYLPERQERRLVALVEGEAGNERLDLLTEAGFPAQPGLPLQAGLPRLPRPACRCGSWSRRSGPAAASAACCSATPTSAGHEAPAVTTDEQFALFHRYLRHRHRDGGMVRMDRQAYREMVEVAPASTRVVEFRDGDGALVGVSLTDRLRSGPVRGLQVLRPRGGGALARHLHHPLAHRAGAGPGPALRLSRLLDRREPQDGLQGPLRAARAARRPRWRPLIAGAGVGRERRRERMSDRLPGDPPRAGRGRTRVLGWPTCRIGDLPPGEVLVDVAWSTLNYKDALAITGAGKIVRAVPVRARASISPARSRAPTDPRFAPGDEVILTGWGVGERHWGGLAQKARVKARLAAAAAGRADAASRRWRSAPPASPRCWRVLALEEQGVTPERGEIVVTGAAGGVGSIAIPLLARRGFKVVASSGRPELDGYLKELGAAEVVDRRRLRRGLQGAARLRPLGRRRSNRSAATRWSTCSRPCSTTASSRPAASPAAPLQRHRVPVHPARRAADRHRFGLPTRPSAGPPSGTGWRATSTRRCSSGMTTRSCRWRRCRTWRPDFLRGAVRGRLVVDTARLMPVVRWRLPHCVMTALCYKPRSAAEMTRR